MVTYEYDLDVTPGGIPVQVNLSQYDQDYELRFRLYSRNGTLDIRPGTAVGIRGTKRDGNGYSVHAAISGDVVTVSGDQQMTAVAGKQTFELTLTDAGKELNTANFTVNVERAALDKETLGSNSVIKELVAVIDRTDEIIAAANKADSAKKDIAILAKSAQDADADARTQASRASEAAESALKSQQNAEKDILSVKTAALKEMNDTYTASMEAINKKAADIVKLTTDADQVSKQALEKASNAENEVAESANAIEALQKDRDAMRLLVEGKVDGAYVENGYLYLTSSDEIVAGPLGPFSGTGGGGGGTGGNNAELSVTNTTGWLSRTIADGDGCEIKVSWSSVEDNLPTGNGTMKITVNGIIKAILDIAQGDVTVDLAKYLNIGSNVVKINVADVYDNNRTINFSVTSIAISVSSTFDASMPYQGAISFPYTPVGSVQKTVHFLLDGKEIGSSVTSVSGRQMSFTIPQQTHGGHVFECYFECDINGQSVRSNTLHYEIICLEVLNDTPIIASSFHLETVQQYTTLHVNYTVYNPASLTAPVELYVNGKLISRQTVDRTQQVFTYRADETGELAIQIVSGDMSKTLKVNVEESDIEVEAETDQLKLYLSSVGRSNHEEAPGTWQYGEICAIFTGFNYTSDGWQRDEDGITVLRVSGDARVEIPYKPFASDFRTTGKTIELEFATRNVMDYDSVILSCLSGGRGFTLTAQKAVLKSEQSEISTQYKEEEHVRIAFVAEKRVENRLIYCYINGILSGVVQYPSDDDFAQAVPVNISVGSNDCTIDLYCIRVYDNNLTRHQILNNWIADTQTVDDMLSRYQRNRIYDEYGNVVIAQLPSDLPYLIIECAELPQYKGDKKTIKGSYVDPVTTSKSFTFEGAQADVQGTSSQYYARKNYKIKFKGGFVLSNGTQADAYSMRPGSVPTNTFTFKADVASSEGANNVELVRLYNDACPYKTPPQKEDGTIRQGIDGFPIVIFWDNGTETTFLGKYNFNNDKGTPEVFGFAEGDESWEIKNNTSDRVLFKSDDFSGTDWMNDFEARYPEDNTDAVYLAELVSWLKSTDQSAATGNALETPVSYGDAEYTVDTAAYRLAKFQAELSEHMEKDAVIFYYLFTELFLMVDSRAKNAFPTAFLSAGGKWFSLPYDFDTAVGINNEGALVFSYNLEDIDTVDGGADVYNGQQSVLWVNLRQAFFDEIRAMYQNLRSTGALSYADTEQRFEEHQAKWPEAIFNEDAWYKYLAPLVESGSAAYLSMLQGSKAEQRKWWLYNRYRYLDSKYNAGDALTDVITVRGYAKANITVTPYADVYTSVKYGSYLVQERAERNTEHTLICPLDNVNDTEIYIYSASQLASVGDLSGLMVGYAEFSMATKLQALKLGDAASNYSNGNLTEIHMGNNVLLRSIDIRNCPNLTQAVDISGCSNVEEVYFDGTAITGLLLPNGGILKKLYLPETITNLTIRNQTAIAELSIPSYANISTLRLENVSAAVDSKAMLKAIPANSRVRMIGFSWEAESVAEIFDLYDLLDTMRGLDENGNNMDTAQMGGTIHLEALTGAELAQMLERYPNIDVTYDHITSYLYYYNYDGSQLLYTESVYDGGDGVYSGKPSRASTAQYTFTFSGWSLKPNGTASGDAQKKVGADRKVYAAYTSTVRTYTVYFYNGSTLLQTVQNVRYGSSASYTGTTPTKTGVDKPEDYEFSGWSPSPTNITGNTSCYAQFIYTGFIQDDWDVIAANVANGSYRDVYGIGGVKELTLTWDEDNTETIVVEIADFDHDDLADGGGKAGITFIAQNLLAESKPMNNSSTNAGGWTQSVMRAYCNDDIFNALPAKLQAVIKEVNKLSDGGQADQSLKTTTDKIWIPSNKEVGFSDSADVISGQGSKYPIFTDNNSRERAKFGTANYIYWWLRSAYRGNGGYFRSVLNNGDWNNISARNSYGVLPCFCIGQSRLISDTWEEIFAAEADGTYKEKYAIGDQKEVELTWSNGTTEKVIYEIADFDHDDLADGSGKAAITWTTRNLLNTSKTMNSSQKTHNDTTAYNAGGWTLSDLRVYCNGDVFNAFPDNIKSAIKEVTKISDGGQVDKTLKSTADKIWIPSYEEVGLSGSSYNVNGQGTKYPLFTDTNSRKRANFGTVSYRYWWLRSTYTSGSNYFWYVNSNGYGRNNGANNTYGVTPCFCT